MKECFELKKLVRVDSKLKRSLAPSDYRPYFKSYFSGKITLPKEFAYPFALFFYDGVILILLASSEEQFDQWTQALRTFEQPRVLKYPIWQRHQTNFFTATLYMCLSQSRPAILLETKFEPRKVQDVIGAGQANDEESKVADAGQEGAQDGGKATGDGELAQAIISCRGQCEGWLYKTSQKLGFF